ncbi:MAG: 4-alpha-glucanotransferase [Alphaproteobacteria bacterium]|nr:4-alpha-glucanotransferase [Alphaproteobacteria bacterium]
MSDDSLKRLARAAGLYVEWTDANGRPHEVKPDTLRSVLSALGFAADQPANIAESQRRLDRESKAIPQLIAVQERESVHVGHAKHARLRTKDGEWKDLALQPSKIGGASIRGPATIGYHELELDDSTHILAVAPPRCYGISEAAAGRKVAGLSVQIYSLRGGHSTGFGDFAALGEFAAKAGEAGVDVLSVSPTHARFASDPDNVSPYTPSSRFFLDPLYADPALAGLEAAADNRDADLIDWRTAHREKYAQLRAAYEKFSASGADRTAFREFCQAGGQRLLDHALFEALDAHFRNEGKSSSREWPPAFRSAKSSEVQGFAEREQKQIVYHFFLQWLASRSAAAAQARALESMAIGIVADMAVGVEPTGSHAWSAPHELLDGLSIGAPPDVFNTVGQDWGLTTYSPTALRASGYESFIATLRASMQHAGGIRIDHAMGLRRLWVLPKGASPADGVYVAYPFHDLLRLIALESSLHKSIVIGEDLGTVPEGFRAQIAAAGVLGMRVLWFERMKDGRFIPPDRWDSHAAALSTTHDLPTVAGWWRGRDIDWCARLKQKPRLGNVNAERRERTKDRSLLWTAFTESGCAKGEEPAEDKAEPVIEGALAYVGRTPCVLAMAAAEDVLALPDQPNIPGTVTEHPNWRRRLPVTDIAADPDAQKRLARLTAHRKR